LRPTGCKPARRPTTNLSQIPSRLRGKRDVDAVFAKLMTEFAGSFIAAARANYLARNRQIIQGTRHWVSAVPEARAYLVSRFKDFTDADLQPEPVLSRNPSRWILS